MKIDSAASSLRFVYPFALRGQDPDACIRRVEAARWGATGHALWEATRFVGEDFLPHLGRYFQPSATPAIGRLWHVVPDALQSHAALAASCEWALRIPRKEPDGERRRIRFQIDAVELGVFAVGIAFVTFTVFPHGDDVADWLDLLHYFRFAEQRRQVELVIERRPGPGPAEPFRPPAFAGALSQGEGRLTIGAVLDWLCGTATGERDRGDRELFVPGQMLPFATLYVDGVPDGARDALRYRIRNFFHAAQPVHPSAEDLRADHPAQLAYAEGQWFLFSLEGGAFAAFDAPPTEFFRRTMPAHVARQYFLVFVIALHQRFALLMLSESVARDWPARCEADMARIRDQLLLFTARGHFAQVMQHHNHHRCYRKWQRVLGIRALYREVHDEVTEMTQHLTMKRAEEVESKLHLLGLLGGFLGFPGLAFAYLQGTQQTLPWWQTLGIGGLAALVGFAFMKLMFRLWARPPDPPERDG